MNNEKRKQEDMNNDDSERKRRRVENGRSRQRDSRIRNRHRRDSVDRRKESSSPHRSRYDSPPRKESSSPHRSRYDSPPRKESSSPHRSRYNSPPSSRHRDRYPSSYRRHVNFDSPSSSSWNGMSKVNTLDAALKDLPSDAKFIDTHCHLDFLFNKLNFRESYSQFRKENSSGFPSCYEGCIAIFCQPDSFITKTWKPIIEKEENVWAAFGCHPHFVNKFSKEAQEGLLKALKHPKVKAVGEIGLDYSQKNNVDRQLQKHYFALQLKIAVKCKLPIVIHSRDSSRDTLKIMKKYLKKNHKIHRHCFTGDWTEAQEWLKEFPKLYIGLTPLVGFPSAKEVHDVAARMPLKRLLLETDAPYFCPRASRCKVSHPGMAVHVAVEVAKLKGISVEKVIRRTRRNTKKMYGI